jgi:hypothetical protein
MPIRVARAPARARATLELEHAFDEREWRRRLAGTAYFGAWEGGPEPRLTGEARMTRDLRERPGR